MANYAEEPVLKITLNLFKKDVDWFREKYPTGWSKRLREAVRHQINEEKKFQECICQECGTVHRR